MTDIVERLETFSDAHSWAVRGDAADEIKRLRKRLHAIETQAIASTEPDYVAVPAKLVYVEQTQEGK